MYLHVYACIWQYMHVYCTSVIRNFFIFSICMYLHVYACIWIVNDKITINTTAKLPKTAQQWTHHQQGHSGTLCSGKKLFIVHFSVGILLVVHWPNYGPGVDVEQGALWAWGAMTVACGALTDSTQPCCHACSREWCRCPQLDLHTDTYRYCHIHAITYQIHTILIRPSHK